MNIREANDKDIPILKRIVLSLTHYYLSNPLESIPDWFKETLTDRAFKTRLNSDEYDYGMANVPNIYLVSCDDSAEERGSTRSMPYNDEDATPLKQSLSSNAGIYEFNDLSNIDSGRYYVMYMAPKGWRMSGNVLPLERRAVLGEEGEYYECVPKGGNGEEFGEMAREVGDFDREGCEFII